MHDGRGEHLSSKSGQKAAVDSAVINSAGAVNSFHSRVLPNLSKP